MTRHSNTLVSLALGMILIGCAGASYKLYPTATFDADLAVIQRSTSDVEVTARFAWVDSPFQVQPWYINLLGGGFEFYATLDQPAPSDLHVNGPLFSEVAEIGPRLHEFTHINDYKQTDHGFTEPYRATLSDVAPGRTVYFALYNRRDVNALESFVVVPEGYTITAPVAGQVFSRSTDNIVFNWSPIDANAKFVVTATSDCSDGTKEVAESPESADTGTEFILAGEFTGSGTCSLTIVVDRYTNGVVDSHYHGGQFRAHQVRQVMVTTVP